MASANEYLEDWSNTNAINILRVEAGIRKDVVKELEKLEQNLVGQIAKASPSKKGSLQALLKDTSATINGSYQTISKNHGADLDKLAKTQIKGTTAALNGAIGVPILRRQVTETQVNAVMKRSNVEGHSSGAWWKAQDKSLRFKFEGQMRQGYLAGEDVGDLAKRIRGTKANNYKDGIMNVSKAQAEALARSSVQTVSNEARLKTIEENDDIVKAVKWMATLDARTTKTCMALDGKTWSVPEYKPIDHDKEFPGPTAHWGCRSTQVPVMPSLADLIGKPIKAMDDMEFQDAVQAKLEAMGMSEEQRAAAVVNSRASMDGQVPKTKTYNEWLGTKSPAFQNQVLGPTRAKLFREGQLTISDLTNQNNRPLRLNQLNAAIDSDGPEIAVETEGIPQTQTPAIKLVADLPQTTLARKLAQGEGYETVDAVYIDGLGQLKPPTPGEFAEYKGVLNLSIDTDQVTGQKLKLDDINLSTDKVVKEDLEKLVEKPITKKIFVVRQEDGSLVAIDGHAEWAAAKLRGDTEIDAFVLDVKQYNAEQKIADEVDFAKAGDKSSIKLVEAMDGLKKTFPNLEPDTLLKQAEGVVIEKQAAATKASYLSKAKKAIAEGKIPTAAQQKAISTLTGPEITAFNEDVEAYTAKAQEKQLNKTFTDDLKSKLEQFKTGTEEQQSVYDNLGEKIEAEFPTSTKDLDAAIKMLNSEVDDVAAFELAKLVVEGGSKYSQINEKTFKETTGFTTGTKNFGDLVDTLPDGQAHAILEKFKAVKAEKTAAATEATYLSKAKNAIAEGKKPTPAQQKAIDNIPTSELDDFYKDVDEKKAAKKTEVFSMKIEGLEAAIADQEKQPVKQTETTAKLDKDVKNLDLYFPQADKLEFVKQLNGSTKPQLMVDPETGKQWVVKSDKFENNLTKQALYSEATADKIYREMGAKVPGSKAMVINGDTYKIAEYVDNSLELGKWQSKVNTASGDSQLGAKVKTKLREHFVLDSLLGNRDVAGQSNDNILVTTDSEPFRIDNGSSLSFRAKGDKKDSDAWGPVVGELESMRGPLAAGETADIFKGISQNEIHNQIRDIVKNKAKILNIASESQQSKDVTILEQRIDYLETLLPAAKKEVKKKVSLRGDGLDYFHKDFETASAKRYGTTIKAGFDTFEDQALSVWKETTPTGEKVVKIQGKLLKKSSQDLMKNLEKAGLDLSGTTAPASQTAAPAISPYEVDGHWLALKKAAGNIGYHASNKNGASVTYNPETMKGLDDVKSQIETFLKLQKDNLYGMADLESKQAKELIESIEVLGYYDKMADDLLKAKKAEAPPSKIWKRYEPKVIDAAPAVEKTNEVVINGVTITRSRDTQFNFTKKVVGADGRLQDTTEVNGTIDGRQFDHKVDKMIIAKAGGVEVTIVPYEGRTPKSSPDTTRGMNGFVRVKIQGDDSTAATIEGMRALQAIGLKVDPPTQAQRELLYIHKTAYLNDDISDPAYKKATGGKGTPEAKLEKVKQWAESKYKITIPREPKDYHRYYNPDGEPPLNGVGDVIYRRMDVDPDYAKKKEDEVVFYHRSKYLKKTVSAWLENGGHTTSTEDRLRTGADMTGGESSETDMRRGGSAFLYSNLTSPQTAQQLTGVIFKGDNLTRVDLASHNYDSYGEWEASATGLRRRSVDKIAEQRGIGVNNNSGLFKNGLPMTEVQYITMGSQNARVEYLKELKAAGFKEWPDGRRLEDVVISTIQQHVGTQ